VLAGRVIRQSPEAGEEVDAGTPVDLVVSRGPEPVTMPNLVGKTRTAAQGLLAAVQLREGSITYEYSDTVARDIVLSQAKTPGSEVPAGTAVDFVVSRGVAPGVVPDIVGELRSDAEADIVAAGLAVGEVTERYDDNVRKDRVIRQTPAAGTELATGSPVNFVVSLGKEPAETSAVPNVVNTPSTSARAAIASAGFVVGAVTEKYDDNIPAGWVIAQSPAGGEERAAGTPVDLVVSLGKYLGPNADEARALLAALFEEADTDGDGKLSWEEALAAVPSLSRAVFDELDTNTDGYLDRAELGLPEEGCGACGCQKGDMTPGGLKQRLGDLFLSALALSVLAAFGRRGR
jgi:beta-lactam-binding protein with PASTA domain